MEMNVFRSGLSACVIKVLPNVYDYIHKHRERLIEEKRQKFLALEAQWNHQQQQQLQQQHQPVQSTNRNAYPVVVFPNHQPQQDDYQAQQQQQQPQQ